MCTVCVAVGNVLTMCVCGGGGGGYSRVAVGCV